MGKPESSDSGSPPRGPLLESATFTIGGETLAVIAISAAATPDLDELTAAENHVCRAMLAGMSNAEIARERGRSINTIENQIASIFRKLDVASRSELAVVARERVRR